jgi:hypothetical protein
VSPPRLVPGAHSLGVAGGGGGPNSYEGTDTVVLGYICTLWEATYFFAFVMYARNV